MKLRHGWTATLFVASVTAGVFLWFVLLVSSPMPAWAAGGDGSSGKAVFLAQKCNLCHAVSSAGIEATTKSEKMKAPDLVGVGSRHDGAWIAQYLQKKQTLQDKTHAKEFKGSDEELAALIDWLLEQK